MDERATKNFNDFIINNNLTDVNLGGTDFTWIKGGGTKLSKLDRFLVSGNFGEYWPNFEAKLDLRLYSDHKPIILYQVKRNYGKIPFKFFNSWLEEEECKGIIKDTWERCETEGQHLKLFVIMQKLKAIKEKLRSWAREKNAKTKAERNGWLERLTELDKLLESGGVTQAVIAERVS